MLKTILIGLDGSPYSTSAVDLGIQWARRFDAMVVGLGIIDEPSITRPEPVPLGAGHYKHQADATRLHRAHRQVEQFLGQFALRCQEAGVASKLLEETGPPAEVIIREGQRFDLVVLGKQTYFQFATQDGPCDTLSTVIRSAPRPVVTIPEKLGAGNSVVIAYDGSLQAARTLQAFEGSGVYQGCAVHIVSIAPQHAEAARHADRAAEFLRFHDVRVEVHPLASSAKPAGVLLDQIRQHNGSLLVMGAYGQPMLREFFLGSVTRTLLKESPVPLFLYH
jgi:nucleotide-binding universal stress UspA family protein